MKKIFRQNFPRHLLFIVVVVLGFFATYLSAREFDLFHDSYTTSSMYSDSVKKSVKTMNIIVGILFWWLIITRIFFIIGLIINYGFIMLFTFPYVIYLASQEDYPDNETE